MQKLPIGIQDFSSLREEGYLYVDKTKEIYELMNAGKFLFLSRPRRFGKSLLTTTLAEIYRGNRALFQGLWIEDKIDWQERPVLLINFNALNYRELSLADSLAQHMDELAADHEIVLTAQEYKGKFRELIERLSQHGEVVLLVDEYDKAITDLLENEEKTREHIDTLKNFYSVLKAPEASDLHFVLLTGVSKYGKISIFSDLNNLVDLTMDARFATLVGYTEEELLANFGDYIDRLCDTFHADRDEVMAQIRFWYNGYSWDGEERVYVPFSTMIFLTQQSFANHWFATATPSFLIKLLKQHEVPAYELEELIADNRMLDSADVHNISVLSMLFQTGYLTVKHVRRSFRGDQYTLGYPNHEVAQSFQQHLLTSYLDANIDRVNSIMLVNLERTLASQNLPGFITVLQSVFASIPHQLFLPQEAYYHSVVYLVLKLLGFAVYAERFTNLGRIDAVLEMDSVVYIMEFKMSTAEAAIAQIREKQYDQPFRGSGKAIIWLGIAFDKESRNIVDWKSETAG